MKTRLQWIIKDWIDEKYRTNHLHYSILNHISKSVPTLFLVLASTVIFCQPSGHENNTVADNANKISNNGILPIINSENIWTGFFSDFMGPTQSYRYSYSEDSIEMGSNHYFARYQSINEDGTDALVQGYYREEGGRLIQYQEASAEEVTILDMSLNLDETITYDYDEIQVTLKVISIDSVQLADDVWRKRIELNCLVDPSFNSTTTWIEGVGELLSYAPHCALDNFGGEIVGVRNEDGGLIYNSVDENDCWTITSTTEIDVSSLIVYPNPARNELFIEGFSNNIDYSIYNNSGQMILNSKTGTNRISLELLQNGMYLLELRSQAKKASIRFVKL